MAYFSSSSSTVAGQLQDAWHLQNQQWMTVKVVYIVERNVFARTWGICIVSSQGCALCLLSCFKFEDSNSTKRQFVVKSVISIICSSFCHTILLNKNENCAAI